MLEICEVESPFSIIEVRMPKSSEKTPEAASQLFSAFTSLPKKKFLQSGPPTSISFEIACVDQLVHFLVVCPKKMTSYVESQISAQYPESLMAQLPKDYLSAYLEKSSASYCQIELAKSFILPIKTFRDLKEVDLLSSLLGTMSKAGVGEFMSMQILIASAGNWQSFAASEMKGTTNAEGKTTPNANSKFIEKKITVPGFWTSVRLIASSDTLLSALVQSFSVYQSEVNRFKKSKIWSFQRTKLLKSCLERTFLLAPRNQIINTDELASIWHPPTFKLSGIKNIAWGKTILTEPPINLPTGENTLEEDKKDVNFFARTEHKNKVSTFGIKRKDRRRHVYIIGKSGTGKSTLIANMGINDLRNGEGMAVIDPHGDLTEILLDYVPANRIDDVCYLDPSDKAHPFVLNPLEIKTKEHKELVASNIVAIFYKLYSYTWGPRLEYILRNTILTLMESEEPTMMQIPDLLTNKAFRFKIVQKLQDPVLKGFWENEFDKMQDKQLSESVAPILNKIGQFLTSPVIRPIVSTYKSTLDLEEIMNSGKILLVNLSQGKIGEDNAALLGAMIITQLQLAAMNRIYIPEEERKDFFLYVDEFQNFATSSFGKILSEARKYRLALTLANQYVGQLEEDLQKAIFGNAGTLISFVIGSADAKLMSSEFGLIYKEEDLVSLGMYQIALKICIDNLTSAPFSATTLPLPRCKNENREKVLRISKEKHNNPTDEERLRTGDFIAQVVAAKQEVAQQKQDFSKDYSNRSFSQNSSFSNHKNRQPFRPFEAQKTK